MIYWNTDKEEVKRVVTELPEDTVIGEFSGRDSVAAILKALESSDINNVLPIASFAGTEYGDLQSIKANYEKLQKRVAALYGDNKKIHPLIVYSRPELWRVFNGRFTTLLIERYGFYNPCIACHLYFHLIRLPFAKSLGNRIISGERESHDGRIKVNQLGQSLDLYQSVIEHFGVELLMPIRHVASGEEIEELIGWDWGEGKNHPQCVFSGNYRDLAGEALFNEEDLNSYLQSFLFNSGIEVGRFILEEDTNFDKLMEKVSRYI